MKDILSLIYATLFYKKYGPIPASYNFNFININWKNVDGEVGIQTQGRRMVGIDETTELWRLLRWSLAILMVT